MTFKKGDPDINRNGRPPKPPGAPRSHRAHKARLTDQQRQQLAVMAGGITPLEFFASILRDPSETMGNRIFAAKELMPYMHRKLPVAVEVKGAIATMAISPAVIAALPPDQLETLMAILGRMTMIAEASVNLEGDQPAAAIPAPAGTVL